MLAKKRFLEGEDTEKAVDRAAHGAHAALPPGPGLRGDQIDHRHTLPAEFLGQPQMEIGGIGEHGDVRALLRNRADQLAEFAVNTRDVRDYFDQSDYRQRARIDDGANPS